MMKTWFMAPIALVALSSILWAAPATAEIEQSGRSGQPLAVFCNVAPELSTQRSDSVDNWVRICSLWLQYSCKVKKPARQSKGRSGGKKINDRIEDVGIVQPGLQLIRH